MSIPTVVVEISLNGGVSWIDISAYVRRQRGITVTRGRNTERSDPDPGTLVFTVDNRDGRFTMGRTGGPYGSAWKRGLPIRYTAAGSVRFTGFLQSAPVSMVAGRMLSDVVVTAVDLLGIMAQAPIMVPWADVLIDEMLGDDYPDRRYWWKLDEPSIATQAAEEARTKPLYGALVGNPGGDYALSDCLQFGQSPSDLVETGTQVQLKMQDDGTGATLSNTNLDWATDIIPGISFGVLYTPTETLTSEQVILQLRGTDSQSSHYFQACRNGWDLVLREWDTKSTTVSATYPGFFTVGVATWVIITQGQFTTQLVTASGAVIPFARPVRSYPAVPIEYAGSLPLMSTLILGPAEGLYCNVTSRLSRPGVGFFPDVASLQSAIAAMTGEGLDVVTSWLQRALEVSRLSSSVAVVKSNNSVRREMQRPPLKGSNPAEVGNTLAQAAGAMWVAARDGTPTWIDPDYCPAAVALSAYDWGQSLTSDVDASLIYTRVDVDGNARLDTGGFPPAGINIPGLLPDDQLRDYVDYLAGIAEISSGPRTGDVTVNLMALDDTTRATYLGLDLKSRFTIADLPSVFPPQWVQTVEGYAETLTHLAWMVRFNTTPDPSLVWEDDVSGLWESNYRLGAL